MSQNCVTKGKLHLIYSRHTLSDTILGRKKCVTKGTFQTVMFKLFILSTNEAYSKFNDFLKKQIGNLPWFTRKNGLNFENFHFR